MLEHVRPMSLGADVVIAHDDDATPARRGGRRSPHRSCSHHGSIVPEEEVAFRICHLPAYHPFPYLF
jgi:hypothetical protein